MNKKSTIMRIEEIEAAMNQSDFWQNSEKAQQLIKEMNDLKEELAGGSKYDKGDAILNIYSGVGGDDAEDFVRMLLEMYMKFFDKKDWTYSFIEENQSEHGGYKSITLEIFGNRVFGYLKHEAGVHRLVRKSPFNANSKRQTSFAMVEVLPSIKIKETAIRISEDDLDIDFTKSSGPGGQNVNKRDTAVRITHKKTGISTFAQGERSQIQNKEKAMEILLSKLYNLLEEQKKKEIEDLTISKDVSAKWGSQIRSYVLGPYQMVKDHRTKFEIRNVEKVFNGEIDEFINKMRQKKE